MEKKIKQWAERFAGYKLTPQRRVVLEVLSENESSHLSAEEVFNLSRKRDRDIGIATIYRTLDMLEEVGIVRKCDFGDGRSRYELSLESQDEHYHHHLICMECRKILEVEEDLLNQLEGLIVDKMDFEIIDHRVQFYGKCRECRTKEK